jgi:hypothetical protein
MAVIPNGRKRLPAVRLKRLNVSDFNPKLSSDAVPTAAEEIQ